MAAVDEKLQELQREITCSICRNCFSEPVTISCGHSFCRTCLSLSWSLGPTPSSCPECRQVSQVRGIPGVSGHLAELTEVVKELCSLNLPSAEGQRQCARHRLTFKLFCEHDQTLLCVRCSQSPEHGDRNLSPVEEAAHNWREKFGHLQRHLEQHLEESEELAAREERPDADWQWMVKEEYKMLHNFLVEEESRCLERIKQEEREDQERLSQHVYTLQDLMLELQEANQQTNVDLLEKTKQFLGRSESVMAQSAKAVSPEMREYLIPGMIERLRLFGVDLTMGPSSANCSVIVSEDGKSVKAGEGLQVETKNPEDALGHYVFAEQAFFLGRSYWEVDVTQLPQWTLGIYTPQLRKSRGRRGRNKGLRAPVFLLSCVKKEENYSLETYPGSLSHRVKSPVSRVGVYLGYSSGTLAFYNVLQRTLIYKFYNMRFKPPIIPLFSPGPPLPGTEAGPMTLCPVDPYLSAC